MREQRQKKARNEEPSYGHSATHPIRAAITVFVDAMRGLKEVMPLLAETAKEAEEKARATKKDAMMKLKAGAPVEDLIKALPERRRLDPALRTEILLPATAAVGLLNAQRDLGSAIALMMGAHFDRFLGEMVRAAFDVKPSLRGSLRREISFTDLAELPDIEAVEALVIEKEVEDVLRRNRAGQIKWFEKNCKKVRIDNSLTAALIDAAELRNLIAHHGGVVTNRVGFGLRNRKTGLLTKYSAGQEILIQQEQVDEVHAILITAAVAISQGVWRSLRKDETKAADRLFHELTYTRLALEEFELAQRLLHIGNAHHDTMSESCRLVKTVNLAQTYKWLGDETNCANVLGSEGWKGHQPPYKLAVAVLGEDWEAAEQLMDQCITEGLLDQAEFEDWPVFRQFRKTSHYEGVFNRVYGA